jgi:EpsI family protein
MSLKTVLVVIGMLLALTASHLLRPQPTYSKDSWPQGRLNQMIPSTFGPWHIDPTADTLIVSPDQKLWLNKLYSDTVSHTYINEQGDKIMLSIAYGADQGRAIQLHKPEVCYEAQGFKLSGSNKTTLQVQHMAIPIVHLLAVQGTRSEPLTYWIRTGNVFVRSALEQQWARLRSGLFEHRIPDGILVRVSSLEPDTAQAYAQQEAFLQALLQASPDSTRKLLIGNAVSVH